MQILLVGLLAIAAGLLAKFAQRLLHAPRQSLATWLRCTVAMSCLAVTGALGLLALDLLSYSTGDSAEPVLEIEFAALKHNEYVAKVSQGSAAFGSVVVEGDAWSVEVHALSRSRTLLSSPGAMLLRPEQISTRFFDLSSAGRSQSRALVELGSAIPRPLDTWPWLQKLAKPLGLLGVRPVALRSNYLPIAAGARFALYADASSLVVEPLNQPAGEVLRGVELVQR